MGVVQFDVRRLDQQLSAGRHRVAGVDGEVHQDLLELARIGVHAREVRREPGLELDVLAQRSAEQPVQLGHDDVEVEHLGTHHLATAEDQQLARQRGRPLCRPDDLLDIVAYG
jgi:hypothetical protein